MLVRSTPRTRRSPQFIAGSISGLPSSRRSQNHPSYQLQLHCCFGFFLPLFRQKKHPIKSRSGGCMKRLFVSVLTLVAIFATLTLNAQNGSINKAPSASKDTRDTSDPALDPESNAHGVHWAKGVVRGAKPTTSVNMTFHGGEIMTSATAQAIFWGTSWTSPGDKITGMDTWYAGFGGSNYAGTNTEYTGSNGTVGTEVTYLGHAIDTTAATGGQRVAPILAEVCKVVGNAAVSDGYYAVYTDLPRGHAGYCAWHSYGTCGSTPVQIAFFWKLDGDAGCDPQSSVAGHSQGLAAIANVSGHELSEAMTDPRNGGWYDRQGAENGDKCAWTFGGSSVTFSNGSKWKIQGEWSNKAFTAGT